MLFALTRSNLPRQLPDRNGIILQLIEIVTVSPEHVPFLRWLLLTLP